MGVWIEQNFLTGRFHATRWRQSPFEDRYGEWPPSPWRLLRALAERWFQYARETGDDNDEERRRLFCKLSKYLPEYHLPDFVWRGPTLKQYQPVGLGWSDPSWKKKKTAAVKEPLKTLVADSYWCIPPGHPVIWVWSKLDLTGDERQLLDRLARRVLYFGRAESYCRLRLLASAPENFPVNCRLEDADDGRGVPVLAVVPGTELRENVLLTPTDAPLLRNATVPPGTAWFYARLPAVPAKRPVIAARHIESAQFVQFAVGGQVYPEMKNWVRLTERIRGSAIKHLYTKLCEDDLEWKERLALFSGKDASGHPLIGHPHTYFALWPEEDGSPARLVVWRRPRPLEEPEIEALWAAVEQNFGWGVEGWRVRFVPLPATTHAPRAMDAVARVWRSVTPFVPPAQRFRFRKNGRERKGESPVCVLGKLIAQAGLVPPISIEFEQEAAKWVTLHLTRERRIEAQRTRAPFVRPGFFLRVTFPEPVAGPLAFGDSCHFGLGLFGAADEV